MLSLVAQGVLLYVVSWLLWRSLRCLRSKTDVNNVPGPKSTSFIKGNLGQLFDINGWDFHDHLATQFGKVVRIFGLFESQQLYIFDPKAIHHIIVKDQHIFEETESFFASNKLAFGDGLFATHGERHRKQRKMMNPVFSNAHMRHMLPMFNDVAQKLVQVIKLKVASGAREIDMLHWMSRAALEMIGQSGLGYSFDPLVEGAEQHPYSKSIREFVPVTYPMTFEREYLLPILIKIGSPRFQRFVVDMMAWKDYRRLREIINHMDQTVTHIFEEKKRALAEGDEALKKQIGQANDIMSILMKANMAAAEDDRLPDEEVLGQMSTFAFAGTDTTSNALSRILHLLSIYPDVQDRLRDEITEAHKGHGELTYDELVSLPFMDAVCRETLRLYPPVHTAVREARQDAVLPLSVPIKGRDGREMHSIMVPKNTQVLISILNVNRDPTLWGPDASEWKPERWLSPLPKALHDARIPGVYSHLMTFIGGGRACIGFKFSQLEMKVVLSVLVSQFRLSPSNKEIVWEMTGIVTPTLKGSSRQPQLPLTVELVETTA
ncbi:hypothetical protein D9615_004271 [Tricholomella constricta]|uniref:Cytochrome P450 n=1 Tax=Tricholomella constricta TaxID=117010 RepID=A0A8H5HFI1_9AGAR|nr:hypothetical protein D9615_004271 [Tricholomella constricta]